MEVKVGSRGTKRPKTLLGQGYRQQKDQEQRSGLMLLSCPAGRIKELKIYPCLEALKRAYIDAKLLKKMSQLKAGDKTVIKTW